VHKAHCHIKGHFEGINISYTSGNRERSASGQYSVTDICRSFKNAHF